MIRTEAKVDFDPDFDHVLKVRLQGSSLHLSLEEDRKGFFSSPVRKTRILETGAYSPPYNYSILALARH